MNGSSDADQRGLLPAPGWSPLTEPYWFAAGRGELVVPLCEACGTHRWPPGMVCYRCHSMEWSWDPVVGRARVYSYTWADHPPPPEGERNIAVVELDEVHGEPVRLLSWVVGVSREQLRCELPVEVTFVPVDPEVSIPVWRPARPAV